MKFREVVKMLKDNGFNIHRQSSSHITFKHSNGKSFIVTYDNEEYHHIRIKKIRKDMEKAIAGSN